MNTINKIINLALNEVGYVSKKNNNFLENKTKNFGFENYTKYAQDLDLIPNFYNQPTNGSDYWCIQFIDWLFVKSFGVKYTKEISFQDKKGQSVETIANLYQYNNQWYQTPQLGDIIFISNKKCKYKHMGIVVSINNNFIYFVDGNNTIPFTENIGVTISKFYVNDKNIVGYGRPNYQQIEKFITFNKNNCPY